MRAPLIVGNWKMNTSLAEAQELADKIAAGATSGSEVIVCPPFPWLVPVAARVKGTAVGVGAQNCWFEPKGAFTGEVSPAMLKEHCQYVIVGHSERRAILSESDNLIAAKTRAVLSHDMAPILCVGETLDQRNAGEAEPVVRRQLTAALHGLDSVAVSRCVVAYEPVWAIGTGVAATPQDATHMAHVIRSTLSTLDSKSADSKSANQIRLLYGGSVTPDNAADLLADPNIDGALVGGASLKADAFLQIVAAVHHLG